jgi:hypothetical protein
MESMSIREILDQVTRGQLRIPAFQRGFVWEPERVAYLMDSIYKNYPFGSLMFWRTKEKLKFDRDLGPFKLPEPKEDYPVDYVLDGQQRVTSIFGVFQTGMERSTDINWLDIYFDLSAEPTAQDSQFLALKDTEVDRAKHFPLSSLFDTTAYRKACEGFDDETIKRIDEMQSAFKETKIPVQISKTDDKATVAIIFERVNRQGVELDTLQLLSAWTWSEDFQLQDQFAELAGELQPFGFAEVGDDPNLLLRCCAGVLSRDASPNALMSLNGKTVREQFDLVINGVKGAVDYLKAHFKVESLNNLPFTTMLVPLACFFAVSGSKEKSYTEAQSNQINNWFWRVSYSKRYSSAVLRNLKTDIEQMYFLSEGKKSTLGEFSVSVDESFFIENSFGMGNVNTKTFLLTLARLQPLSFVSGHPVALAETLKAANRTEFHHMMPRDFLKKSGQSDKLNDNALANLCFLARADNRLLGGAPPSVYRKNMPNNIDNILKSAACPSSLFDDDYEAFLTQRASLLADMALNLCGLEKAEL